MILTKHNAVIDNDLLSEPAALEILVGAITGLVPNPIAAQIQVNQAMEAIKNGQTITIENEASGASFIFQIPRRKTKNKRST